MYTIHLNWFTGVATITKKGSFIDIYKISKYEVGKLIDFYPNELEHNKKELIKMGYEIIFQ